MKHTSLPWTIKFYPLAPRDGRYIIWGDNGSEEICMSEPWPNGNARTKANAAFIVKAVNNHEQLLTALKELSSVCQCENGCEEDDMTYASNLAREAIKQAEES